MDDSSHEYLSGRYAVAEWPPITPGLIYPPDPTNLDLAGWVLVKSRTLHVAQARTAWLGLWRPTKDQPLVLLRIDLVDTTGPEAAREQLLDFLGEFQSPLVLRHNEPLVGDIAFGPPNESTLIFLRANVVVALRNAEREVVSVIEQAQSIDNQLQTRFTAGPTSAA